MLEEVFRQVGVFFTKFCAVEVELFGVSFTVGAIIAFSLLSAIIIKFVRGLIS